MWWQVSAREPACGGGVVKCDAQLMASRAEEMEEIGWSRARGFPFVRIELQQCGLV